MSTCLSFMEVGVESCQASAAVLLICVLQCVAVCCSELQCVEICQASAAV